MPKSTPTPENNPVTFRLWNDQVDPIVQWCKEERGRKSALIQAVQASALPESLTFNMVAGWLNEDVAKRVQPQFGNGLLLVQVFKNYTAENQ